jgi:hypothetical protein
MKILGISSSQLKTVHILLEKPLEAAEKAIFLATNLG